jgi:hypothetical protein
MGDRVLFQVINGPKFSPVIYCHNMGSAVPEICRQLGDLMGDRFGDVEYTAAQLLRIASKDSDGPLGFGIWNADKILTVDDSHGDAGVVLIDIYQPTMRFHVMGGYLELDCMGLPCEPEDELGKER